jgi:hypothetical protein
VHLVLAVLGPIPVGPIVIVFSVFHLDGGSNDCTGSVRIGGSASIEILLLIRLSLREACEEQEEDGKGK